jgi:hypothetical protein
MVHGCHVVGVPAVAGVMDVWSVDVVVLASSSDLPDIAPPSAKVDDGRTASVEALVQDGGMAGHVGHRCSGKLCRRK